MELGGSLFNFLTSMYSSDLKSYTSACETDSFLKSFDSSLQKRTKEVIISLTSGGNKTQSPSLDSHLKVYEFLFQLYQDTVKFIVDNEEEVWKNEDLKSLVDVYFKNTKTILDFCNTVQNCVNKAKMNQLKIQIAVEQFEKDEEENGDHEYEYDDDDEVTQKRGMFAKTLEVLNSLNPFRKDLEMKKNKYGKTLEALNNFTAMEHPFNEDFLEKYKLVSEEQRFLLDELHKLKSKLDKKLKNVKTWRILSNAFFATALVSVLVLSMAAAEYESPGLVLSISSLLTGPLVRAGTWCNDMCQEYEKVLKKQKIEIESFKIVVEQMNVPMENMKAEAEGLKGKIEFILERVNLAVKKEDEVTVRRVMQQIKDKIDEFTEKIEQVGEAAVTCSKLIARARLHVLERINSFSLPSGKSVADN